MFTKATSRPLYHEVVNQLCEMILSGVYAPGDLLPSESELCSRMGVSRTTIREALRILQERNIIETRKGKGSVVLSDDFCHIDESARAGLLHFRNTFENAVQARLLIEPATAKLACRTATAQDLADMQTAIAVCRKKDLEGTATSKDLRKFHILVARSTHNPILESMTEMMIELCDAPPNTDINAPNPGLNLRTGINVSHEMILDAIREQREDDAFFYMKENIREFYRNTLSDMESGPESNPGEF